MRRLENHKSYTNLAHTPLHIANTVKGTPVRIAHTPVRRNISDAGPEGRSQAPAQVLIV